MTLLMALRHTHDGIWYFFRCYKSNTLSWHTSNFESANEKSSYVFPDVILVSSYHNYKEKKIRLLPYHSFYGGHIPQEKLSPLSWKSA